MLRSEQYRIVGGRELQTAGAAIEKALPDISNPVKKCHCNEVLNISTTSPVSGHNIMAGLCMS